MAVQKGDGASSKRKKLQFCLMSTTYMLYHTIESQSNVAQAKTQLSIKLISLSPAFQIKHPGGAVTFRVGEVGAGPTSVRISRTCELNWIVANLSQALRDLATPCLTRGRSTIHMSNFKP